MIDYDNEIAIEVANIEAATLELTTIHAPLAWHTISGVARKRKREACIARINEATANITDFLHRKQHQATKHRLTVVNGQA